MKTFYVWMHNLTDSKDDEPVKVKAKDKKHAEEQLKYRYLNFRKGNTYTRKEFFEAHPDWRGLI